MDNWIVENVYTLPPDLLYALGFLVGGVTGVIFTRIADWIFDNAQKD